jgi:hypothetical protein
MRNHLTICFLFNGNCLNYQFSLTSFFLSHLLRASAGGEYLDAHVAARFGPFVVLLGKFTSARVVSGL